MKIIKGDTVKIISGKDRGKTGTVLHALAGGGQSDHRRPEPREKAFASEEAGRKRPDGLGSAPARGLQSDARLLFLQGADARRRPHGRRPESAVLQKMQSKDITTMATLTDKKENSRRKEIRGFLEKIVVDAGVGRMSQMPNFEEKALVQVMRDLAAMTGQKAQIPPREEIHRGIQDPGKPDRGRPGHAPERENG